MRERELREREREREGGGGRERGREGERNKHACRIAACLPTCQQQSFLQLLCIDETKISSPWAKSEKSPLERVSSVPEALYLRTAWPSALIRTAWPQSEKSPLERVSSVPEAIYFDTSNG